MFAKFSHAVLFQFRQQRRDGATVETVIGKAGRHAHLLEELTRCGDGGIDTLVVRAFGNIPHALGILQQLLRLGIAFLIPQRRQLR